MRKRKHDDDPMIDFQYTELVRQSEVGLVVQISSTTVWLPVAECEWDEETVSMPRSLALFRGLVSRG